MQRWLHEVKNRRKCILFLLIAARVIFLQTPLRAQDSCQTAYNSCVAAALSNYNDCFANASGAAQRNACVAARNQADSACTAAYNACESVTGYINPKYIVLGVTYAPPGPASFVNYTNSVGLATTNSLKNTFKTGHTYTVTISSTVGIEGWKVGTKVSTSNTASQSTVDSQSVTLSWSTGNSVQTYGTPTTVVNGSFTSPVDNDYDIIYVWLNPVEVITLSGAGVTWNGYGYDATDQNGLDIVGIPLGYLNGHFGAMPPDILASTNRTWAAGQIYNAGQSAALNSTDFAKIAGYDPFSSSSYGTTEIGYAPPNPTTADNRFTLTTCNNGNSVSFLQAAPSATPGAYTCTLNYSNLTTNAKSKTTETTNTFSIDRSYSGSIFQSDLSIDLAYQYTTDTITEVDSSIATTTSTSAQASITGLPCGNTKPGVGPCVPVWNGPPTQFNIYEDNLYGTFMFAPVHYF